MMTFLEVTTTAVLGAASVLHLIWALGIWWPIRDERALARAVVGKHGIAEMPGAVPCALVGTALGMLAVWLHFPHAEPLVIFGTAAAAGAFLVRGLAAYTPVFRRLTPEPAFRRNDTRFFGPLCLALGVALAVLAVAR